MWNQIWANAAPSTALTTEHPIAPIRHSFFSSKVYGLSISFRPSCYWSVLGLYRQACVFGLFSGPVEKEFLRDPMHLREYQERDAQLQQQRADHGGQTQRLGEDNR
jgi:hypothetical protein